MGQVLKPSFRNIAKHGNQILSVEYLKDYLDDQEAIQTRSHTHAYIEILWILEGSGKLHVDLQYFELVPGHIYFIRPDEVHTLQCTNDTRGYALSLAGKIPEDVSSEIRSSFLVEILALIPQEKRIQVKPCFREDIEYIVERMIKETSSSHSFSNEILLRYFSIFLFYLRKQSAEIDSQIIQNRNMQVLQQFKELVNTHYKTKKMVADYASELNLTPNYLNEIIKKLTGQSAGNLIRQRVALEAKRYAMHSGVCMKEIGYHLGFSDMAHFSKFFKSVVGSNFTEFKNTRMRLAMDSIY